MKFPDIDFQALLQQLLYDQKNPLLFNSGFFVYFFLIFLILYYVLRNKPVARTILFCFASLFFFYKASGWFVLMVVVSAVADYFLSNLIYVQTDKQAKKILLITSIIFNLGILFYFKYTNFFITILNTKLSAHINPLNILLPIGISFYTFENISYTVDVYNGKFKPVKKFSQYLLFLSFFPKLVMGPIVRAADFIPQIHKKYYVSKDDFYEGFYLILSGLFKKLIISDFITLNFVDYIFDYPTRYTGLECLMAVYGYAIVIYCDFSGYSSVAIGIARWLGYHIPANFMLPYQSKNLSEFWKRWHISLSTWLRDYLYIPLGGNRKGKIRTFINLFITMLLGGLWHGANWTFLIWGAIHGLGLSIHKLWEEKSADVLKRFNTKPLYNVISIIVTFHFVCLGWIFFKSDSFEKAMALLRQIKYHFNADKFAAFIDHYHSVLIMMVIAFLLHCLPEKIYQPMLMKLQKVGFVGLLIIFFTFLLLYGYLKSATPVMPIYLQF